MKAAEDGTTSTAPDAVLSALTKLRRVINAVAITDVGAAQRIMPKIDDALTETLTAIDDLRGRVLRAKDPRAAVRGLRTYRDRWEEAGQRLTAVIEAVFVAAEADGMSLGAIADETGFSKSYVHRTITEYKARTAVPADE